MDNVYHFSLNLGGDVPSYEVFPIYDDEIKQLVGGFTLVKGNMVKCFISGSNHPVAIKVSTGDKFYFTPKDGPDGKVAYGIVSEVSLSPISILVKR